MNSYSLEIAQELKALKMQGAEISDRIINLVQGGRAGLGAMAADNIKDEFDVSDLDRLSELASREDYPEYWARIDAAGGWRKGKEGLKENINILNSLFS